MNPSFIDSSKVKLAQEIRDYVKSQTKLQRKIPLLALQASGRTGYQDNWDRAYSEGMQIITSSSSDGWYQIGVDCSTGELINYPIFCFDKKKKPAYDQDVINLSTVQLDAQTVLTALISETKVHHRNFYKSEEQVEKWREEMTREFGTILLDDIQKRLEKI